MRPERFSSGNLARQSRIAAAVASFNEAGAFQLRKSYRVLQNHLEEFVLQ